MTLPTLSPLDIQLGQLLIGITTAVFIGARFLPPRHRPIVGRVMTACYVLGAALLAVYVFYR